jgi:hypothetical protein
MVDWMGLKVLEMRISINDYYRARICVNVKVYFFE